MKESIIFNNKIDNEKALKNKNFPLLMYDHTEFVTNILEYFYKDK